MLLGQCLKDAGLLTESQFEKLKVDKEKQEQREYMKKVKARKATALDKITPEMAKKWFGLFSVACEKMAPMEAMILVTAAVEAREMTQSAIQKTISNYMMRLRQMTNTKDGFKELLFWWEKKDGES